MITSFPSGTAELSFGKVNLHKMHDHARSHYGLFKKRISDLSLFWYSSVSSFPFERSIPKSKVAGSGWSCIVVIGSLLTLILPRLVFFCFGLSPVLSDALFRTLLILPTATWHKFSSKPSLSTSATTLEQNPSVLPYYWQMHLRFSILEKTVKQYLKSTQKLPQIEGGIS